MSEEHETSSKPLEKRPERNEKGQWKPGQRGGPGRAKGTKNRFTQVKEAMLEALEQAKVDGDVGGLLKFLVNVAENEPLQFLRCVTSILPKEIKQDITKHGVDEFQRELEGMSEEELRRVARVVDIELDEPQAGGRQNE